jgi:hypothetical protein
MAQCEYEYSEYEDGTLMLVIKLPNLKPVKPIEYVRVTNGTITKTWHL